MTSDYAKWLATTDQATIPTDSKAAGSESKAPALSGNLAETPDARRQRKRDEAERRNRLTPLKQQVARYDAELARLANKAVELQTALAAPGIYAESAKERLRELLARKQTQLTRETEAVENAWIEASEQLSAGASIKV